jgi:methionine-R-sulfoxide reductase
MNQEEEWKQKLTPEQYKVLREKGTEAPFSGEFLDNYEDGTYKCVACGNKLFNGSSKYESKTPGLIGWPSFQDVIDSGAVKLQSDDSLGMKRTEVVCAKCGGHLGHLFDDELSPNGKHYCINSVCLEFDSGDK